MTSTTSDAGPDDRASDRVPGSRPVSWARWGVPVQLGGGRVLHSGRRLWLRAVAWLLLLCFLTAAAYGLLTGGAFGPEASVFALVLVGAVAVAALSLAGRAGRLRVEPASTSPSGPGLR
jgi:hypothetical protein